ncbi:MAG: DUF3854 domain-containing protein, partial [Bdellovibrionales bacterium]|nr:DUF3854 domain-containing protein [Bdellovibrionales bacterium]
MVIVVLGLSLFLTMASHAGIDVSPDGATISCSELANGKTQLSHLTAFQIASKISEELSQALSEPFRIRGRLDSGVMQLQAKISLFEGTVFSVSADPIRTDVVAAKTLRFVQFGYKKGEFQDVGELNFVTLDGNGNVLEVGGNSEEVLKVFQYHLRGRVLTKKEKARISFVNRKIFEELRHSPTALRGLSEFKEKRGWPEGLTEKNQVVLYDSALFNLVPWAKANQISHQDLVLAGWMRLSFDRNGKPRFSPRVRWAALIPFFDSKTGKEIVSWRMRQLSDNGGPKYLSWPKDRSYFDEDISSESLFNSWKLPTVRGKQVILTEGEFKCMVTEHILGVVALGIPGINQFTEAMAEKIKKSGPKEVIVMLDRDPRGKGYFNADGLTNTQREAYNIAMSLMRAGVNVRIATVPNAFKGSKAGIDDVLLKAAEGKAIIERALLDAASPEVYARRTGIFPELMELKESRRLLDKAIGAAAEHTSRVGSALPQGLLDQALDILNSTKQDFQNL